MQIHIVIQKRLLEHDFIHGCFENLIDAHAMLNSFSAHPDFEDFYIHIDDLIK